MKVFAIIMIVLFFMTKVFFHALMLTLRRGYETDFEHLVAKILPIMGIMMYGACFYLIADMPIGFIVMIILTWLMLAVGIIVMKMLPFGSLYVTATDNYKCYLVAKGTIDKVRRKSGDIVLDDNIGVGSTIKITFNTRKLARKDMQKIIGGQFVDVGAIKSKHQLTFLEFMIYCVGGLFDLSFLINICML